MIKKRRRLQDKKEKAREEDEEVKKKDNLSISEEVRVIKKDEKTSWFTFIGPEPPPLKNPEQEQEKAIARKLEGAIKMKGSTKSFTRYRYKPQHGIRMDCPLCGWSFKAHGFNTKKERDIAEKEQRKLHTERHKHTRKSQMEGEKEDPDKTLQVKNSLHAYQLTHFDNQTNTRFTTNSNDWTLVSGAGIGGGVFSNTIGKKFLVIVTADLSLTGSTDSDLARKTRMCAHVTKGGVMLTDSEIAVTAVRAVDSYKYFWWGFYQWSGTDGLSFYIKHDVSSTNITMGVDNLCITAIKITDDFRSADYRSDFNSKDTVLWKDSPSAANNATINITPVDGNHQWLILSKARYGVGIQPWVAVRSRLTRSGEVFRVSPIMQQMAGNAEKDKIVLCGAKVDTLSTVSQTYYEASEWALGPQPPGATTSSPHRTHSGIFMMDISLFVDVATSQENGVQRKPNSSTTNYAELVDANSLKIRNDGDAFWFSFVTMDPGEQGSRVRMRRQINNVDAPPTQTSDSYTYTNWHVFDRLPMCWQTVELHDISGTGTTFRSDIDGSLRTWDGPYTTPWTVGTIDRTQVAFSFELLKTIAVAVVPTDNVRIAESTLFFKGSDAVKLRTEPTVNITETTKAILSSTAEAMIPANLEFHLSGGLTNTDPHLSLGGEMSIAQPGVAIGADYLAGDYLFGDYEIGEVPAASGIMGEKIFDDVLYSETISGDEPPPGVGGGDYRCVYIYNTHSILTMQAPTIWISQNTPAEDEIHIGAGTAAVNTDEQSIPDEDTAPTGVTFILANFEGGALVLPDIPPLGKKAFWLRRTIAPGTPAPWFGNSFIIRAKFFTNSNVP